MSDVKDDLLVEQNQNTSESEYQLKTTVSVNEEMVLKTSRLEELEEKLESQSNEFSKRIFRMEFVYIVSVVAVILPYITKYLKIDDLYFIIIFVPIFFCLGLYLEWICK